MEGPSLHALWLAHTGGGRAADYLRWLAAQFEIYRAATDEGMALEVHLSSFLPPEQILPAMRQPFADWLVARFSPELS